MLALMFAPFTNFILVCCVSEIKVVRKKAFHSFVHSFIHNCFILAEVVMDLESIPVSVGEYTPDRMPVHHRASYTHMPRGNLK